MIGAWLGQGSWPGGAALGVLLMAFILGAIPFSFLIGADGVVLDTFATGELGTAREPARYTEALAKL